LSAFERWNSFGNWKPKSEAIAEPGPTIYKRIFLFGIYNEIDTENGSDEGSLLSGSKPAQLPPDQSSQPLPKTLP